MHEEVVLARGPTDRALGAQEPQAALKDVPPHVLVGAAWATPQLLQQGLALLLLLLDVVEDCRRTPQTYFGPRHVLHQVHLEVADQVVVHHLVGGRDVKASRVRGARHVLRLPSRLLGPALHRVAAPIKDQ